jgi:MarR family transcriptional regulator, organic hydroperoxide resistance regulator
MSGRGAAADAVGRSFKGAVAAMRRMRGRRLVHGELSDAQYGLLFGLCERDAASLSELAYSADVSPASATEMLDALEKNGLVQRERSERDRRLVLISLTDRGRQLVEERRAKYAPRWRAALSEFSEDELLTASAVLDSLRRFFDERADDDPEQPQAAINPRSRSTVP